MKEMPRGTWLAQSAECGTLDRGLVSSSPMLGVENHLKIKSGVGGKKENAIKLLAQAPSKLLIRVPTSRVRPSRTNPLPHGRKGQRP